MIESKKNKERCSKQDDVHTAGSCDVLPVDCQFSLESYWYILSSDTSGSIAWSTDDVFAKVMGKERKGRIRGVGFGPSPSG
ncbi:hypothetical protein SO802_014075 [Lithocarpus litseifolius]|uniref:Uncharacterized protein n=1 Tax=Lithocarpus litseifolius TaxID=425828 RepID=A0AAW2D8T4_9ROSI